MAEIDKISDLLSSNNLIKYKDVMLAHTQIGSLMTNQLVNYPHGGTIENTLILCPYRNILKEIIEYLKIDCANVSVELDWDEYTTPGEVLSQLSFIPNGKFTWMSSWCIPKLDDELGGGCEAWVTWESLNLFVQWVKNKKVDFRYVSRRSIYAYQDLTMKLPDAPLIFVTDYINNVPVEVRRLFKDIICVDEQITKNTMNLIEKKICVEQRGIYLADDLFEKLVFSKQIQSNPDTLSFVLRILCDEVANGTCEITENEFKMYCIEC